MLPIHTNASVTITAHKPGYPKAIHFQKGTVIRTVRRLHVPEDMHQESINMDLTGLDSLQYPIESTGGVMGTDSSSRAKRRG